ncbi:hypothetical protein PTKIN_Ptkin16aG0104700 [Pterospermum kingtungense]
MAEGVLFDIAGKVLESLSPLALRELSLASNVKSELRKLKNTVTMIKSVLLDAEEQHNRNNNEVRVWLSQLKDAVYDVDDLLDDFGTEALRRKTMKGNKMSKKVRIFFSKSNQLAYRLKMGHKVKALREELDAIADDRLKFQFSDRPLESQIESRETHSFVRIEEVIGREDDRNEMIKLLLETSLEGNLRVVPIVGIGGLGKTTLAQMVFNDEKVRAQFELKMWVCVSDRFEVKTVVEKILEAATKNKPQPNRDIETLQTDLRNVIHGKKYFLVLDDVWDEDADQKWSRVKNLLMGGASGSRIVVTTRSELVGRLTGTISPYFLKGLSKSRSLSLFKNIAFEKQIQTSNCPDLELETIGEKIVERCAGVPLAIKAIGRTLCFKRTKLEWSRVLENITQHGTGIEPILRLSYDHLPSHLKQCFAYCSLFPKDYEINKHALINLWMAQGFLQSSVRGQSLEDVGHDYFMDLLWRSFFQEVEADELGNIESCKMHDLMHDLAKSVAGTKCCLTSVKEENIDENTRHVSLLLEESDSSRKIPSSFLKAKKIRTFLLPNVGYLSEPSSSIVIRNFKCLRMLDLKDSNLEKLPPSICRLKHLRYLDLSENDIRELPNCVTRLQNLQTLDLSHCTSLMKLPREIENMMSLKHLSIEDCSSLEYMPAGVGQLTSLRTLELFKVGRRGRHIGELRELDGLNNLRGELEILSLGNAIPEIGAAYLKEKSFLESLILKWDRGEEGRDHDEMVLESLQPHPNIKMLLVWYYRGAKFSNWLSSLTSLVHISIYLCRNCRNLPRMDLLPCLKSLTLCELDALEHVSETGIETSTATVKPFFPSLEYLKIWECPNLKGWWTRRMKEEEEDDDGDDESTEASTTELLPCFPRLSALDIWHCPKLSSIPLFPTLDHELILATTSGRPLQQTMKMRRKEKTTSAATSSTILPLSNLKSLTIEDCPDLTLLPTEVHAFNSLQYLQIFDCPNLMVLPRWISNLTSLRKFAIEYCPKLQSLPEGMSRLTNLNSVRIRSCPHLKERCQRDRGADWTKISHVPDIDID